MIPLLMALWLVSGLLLALLIGAAVRVAVARGEWQPGVEIPEPFLWSAA